MHRKIKPIIRPIRILLVTIGISLCLTANANSCFQVFMPLFRADYNLKNSSLNLPGAEIYERIEVKTGQILEKSLHPGYKIIIKNILYHALLNVQQHSTNQTAKVRVEQESSFIQIYITNLTYRNFPYRLTREFKPGEKVKLTKSERGESIHAGVSHQEMFVLLEMLPPDSRMSWKDRGTTIDFSLKISLDDRFKDL